MSQVIRIDWQDDKLVQMRQDYLDSRSDTNYSDLPGWRQLFHKLYGHRDFSYLCLEQGKATGLLSLSLINSPFLGRQLVTAPFFGRGGLYAEHETVCQALLKRAAQDAHQAGVDFVEIRKTEVLPVPWKENGSFSEFDLELTGTAGEVWEQALSSNARQNVRKSERHGLRFEVSPDSEPTYRLLGEAIRDLGTPFHNLRFLGLATELLGQNVTFSRVWRGKTLVDSAMVVRYRDTIATPYVTSLRTYRELSANYFHYWKLIEWAMEEGVTRFELGRSPRGSTHEKFKLKWGARPISLVYSYLTMPGRENTYRSVAELSIWFRAASWIWRRTPLIFTQALGHRFFRYIS